jgi:hypothetical protein
MRQIIFPQKPKEGKGERDTAAFSVRPCEFVNRVGLILLEAEDARIPGLIFDRAPDERRRPFERVSVYT